MKKPWVKVYKVVEVNRRFIRPIRYSAVTYGPMRKRYYVHKTTRADVGGLLVFQRREDARRFKGQFPGLELWEAAARLPVVLPPTMAWLPTIPRLVLTLREY
ncbi:hypothetical protein LCGC14_1835610, partial [marine sediment metagenome]